MSASRGMIDFVAVRNKLFLSLFFSDAMMLNYFPDESGANIAWCCCSSIYLYEC